MSTQNKAASSIVSPLMGVGAVILILAGMWAGKSIVNLVLFAALLTLLCVPLSEWLQKKGLNSGLAVTLIILLVLFGALLLIGLVGVSAASVVLKIPEYQDLLSSQSDELAQALQARGVDISAFTSTLKVVATALFGLIAGIAANLVGFLVDGAFMLLIFGYMLADANNLGGRLRAIVPLSNPFLARASESASSVGTYMLILTVVNLIIGILDFIFLSFLGIPHALLWAILAFVFGYVPYIGYWVSLIPPMILAFLQSGISGAIVIILGYWLINGMISTVIAPRFYGKGLNLSSIVTLIATLAWGALLGPIGSIVGVPMTAIIKSTVLDNYAGTHWLASAMSRGDGTPTKLTPKSKQPASGA
jgi:AI-2 transport protein TqsA